MFLTAYLVAAVCVGCGAARALEALRGAVRASYATPVALGVVALWAALLVQTNFPLLDLSGDTRARDDARALFAVADERAVIIGRWTDVAPLDYLQTVEGTRRDVSLVHAWALSSDELRDLALHNANNGRTVYAPRRDAALRKYFRFSPVGDWYRLIPWEKYRVKEAP